MEQNDCVLDKIEYETKRHVWMNAEQKYTAHALWILGTYFLRHHQDVKVFRAFPRLSFMSPEANSGKSTALELVRILSHNALKKGRLTPAYILGKIDRNPEQMFTVCHDEIDNVFIHGRDNSELISLWNLGYECNSVICRLDRFGPGEKETNAYCPFACAGLKVATIPGPSKSRTIIIDMQPAPRNEQVIEYMDDEALKTLKEHIEKWVEDPTTLEQIKTVDWSGPETAFLINRDKQIWRPLLAVAKICSDEWYQRAVKAAKFFTEGREDDKDMGHIILLGLYKVFRMGNYDQDKNAIHSFDLLEQLHELGISDYIKHEQLAKHLSTYNLRSKQLRLKVNGIERNRNGYEFRPAMKEFKTYITQAEIDQIEKDLGLSVDPVDTVDGIADTDTEIISQDSHHSPMREGAKRSTPSTTLQNALRPDGTRELF